MPNCRADEGEARVGRGDPLRATRVDAVAHRVELGEPVARASCGSSRMMRTAAAPWSGGIDHIVARELEHDAPSRVGRRLGRSGLDEQRADAVAIDAEILVAALRDDRPRRTRSSTSRDARAHPRRGRGRSPDRRCRRTGSARARDDQIARPRATGRRSRSAPVGLWQQPWSRATSPGARLLAARRSCPSKRIGAPARARNKDIRPSRARPRG